MKKYLVVIEQADGNYSAFVPDVDAGGHGWRKFSP